MDEYELKKLRRELDLPVRPDWPTTVLGAQGILAADSLGEPGHDLAKWLADTFNHNFDEYDKAIDAVYNETHIGGSVYHHLIDGQHDLWGALDSVKDVKADDGFAAELMEASEHLLRDTMSVSGVNPLFSLSPEQFDSVAQYSASMGVSKAYLADALMVNGSELIGGAIALAASVAVSKKLEPNDLSRLAGGCLLSAFASANPILLPVGAGAMAYAIGQSAEKKPVMMASGNGALVSGSAILASSIIGGPMWLGCVAGLCASIMMSHALTKKGSVFEKVDGFMESSKIIIKKSNQRYIETK